MVGLHTPIDRSARSPLDLTPYRHPRRFAPDLLLSGVPVEVPTIL